MDNLQSVVEFLKARLKTPQSGVVPFIGLRTALQLCCPDDDQLTYQVRGILEKHLHELKDGTLLDVGCYGGWLYRHVKNQVEYHGIDIWEDAVKAGQMMFGDSLFEVADFMKYQKKHDIVWCSQILFRKDKGDTGVEEAWEKLKSLSNRLTILISPQANHSLPGATEFYKMGSHGVLVRRES